MLLALLFSLRPVYEPDLWWHLAQGRETVTHSLVRSNVFGAEYGTYRQHYTPWLSDVAAYVLYEAGGGTAIQLAQAALLALAIGFLYLASRERAPAAAAFSALALAVFVFEARALPRPYLVTFAGVALCTWLVERSAAQGRARPLMLAMPLIALWSNLHVGCAFGVMVVGLFGASELIRPAALARREAIRAVGIAIGCLVAMLANPYGWGIFAYLVENTRLPQLMVIAEVQPPYLPTYRAFFVFTIVAALALVATPRRLALRELVTASAVVWLGLSYLRLTPLVPLAMTPMLAARFGRLIARGVHPRALVIASAAIAVVAVPFGPGRFVRDVQTGDAAVTPPAFFSLSAIEFLRRNGAHGTVFNSNNLGGFLAWHLYPDVRTFQDGRLQTWPPEHFRAILAAAGSQAAWDDLVRDVDWAVVSLRQTHELSGAGRFPPPEWQVVYQDEAVVVFRRSPPPQ